MDSWDLVRRMILIAKQHEVHVVFDINIEEGTSGWANPLSRLISISTKQNHDAIVSTFFHELSHVLDFKDGMFFSYYKAKFAPPTMLVYDRVHHIRRLALRVERHADFRAQRMMRDYFPDMRFEPAYQTDKDIQWLMKRVVAGYDTDTK